MVLSPAIVINKKTLPLVIRPAGDTCNLRCTYCYLGAAVDSRLRVMDLACLERLTAEAASTSNAIEFLWHGGEPLLAGLDFFKSAIDFQLSHPHVRFQNFIQTNGTLINGEWANLFASFGFKIRLSLDGPKAIHDLFRTYKSHGGSHADVLEAIHILRRAGVEPSVSCVVTEESVPAVCDIYKFFREYNIFKVSFLPAFLEVNGEVVPPTLSPEGYVRVYSDLFDVWSRDRSGMAVRELEGIVGGLLGRPSGDCTFMGTCTAVARVEPDGSVYPCELHKGKAAERYGRIGEETLHSILVKRYTSKVACLSGRHVAGECQSCEWYGLCRGGCHAAYIPGVDGTEYYYYCEARKRLFGYIRDKVTQARASLSVG